MVQWHVTGIVRDQWLGEFIAVWRWLGRWTREWWLSPCVVWSSCGVCTWKLKATYSQVLYYPPPHLGIPNSSDGNLVLITRRFYCGVRGLDRSGHYIWEASCFRSVPQSNCVLTSDKSKASEAEVVVFHARDLTKDVQQSVPKRYSSTQLWLYVNQESPGEYTHGKVRNIHQIRQHLRPVWRSVQSNNDIHARFWYNNIIRWLQQTDWGKCNRHGPMD